ncbi:hypothetical protein [Blastococcus tunisiensis]|uniref:Uncharacterized protein n=1 Tax=Blastococcus tunisiensis TaxID=1798228 RepID=A0A1I1Z936_9ACTN|nr:hypothetical protein [Blastococcus sp. DSM 46838]SFE28364.1 hypothetical protein SAMN05216574_10316 [Blastococcus sp. DSM 46838]
MSEALAAAVPTAATAPPDGPAARPAISPGAARRPVAGRLALLLPGGVALLAGLDAALILLDLPAPVRLDRLPQVHGVLLVLGFVGTLVALERAVALRRPAGFLAPALLGLGGLLLITPLPLQLGQTVQVLGAAAFVGVYVALWRRQRDDAVLVQALGAALAGGAAILWLGGVPVPLLLPWLVGFVVLTIGGERLELARLAMGPGAGTTLVLLAAGLLGGIVAALLWPAAGTALLGTALLALVGWLAAHDVARRTIRARGLTRFMAGCMLAGYVWLGVAGAIWLVGGPATTGVRYDAVVHAVFLGFTISMIMAHAPVILPAVLRRPLPYTPALVAPAVLLHGSLALRLWAGDALGHEAAWRWGGVLNIAAVVLFVALAVGSVLLAARRVGAPR